MVEKGMHATGRPIERLAVHQTLTPFSQCSANSFGLRLASQAGDLLYQMLYLSVL
jgi:hypothetical protein